MTVQVAIDAHGQVYVGSEKLAASQLEGRFRSAVAQDAKVEMHLQADRNARYDAVAETMAAARRAGLTRIGFVTQPVK